MLQYKKQYTKGETHMNLTELQEKLSNHWSEELLQNITQHLISRAFDIALALLIGAAGFFVSRWIRKVLYRILTRANVEHSAITFITESMYYLLLFIVFLMALGTLGVSTTTLSAAMGGIGLGIGLALKDKAGNVASGIFILLFHPYRVGDYVSMAGYGGTVKSIRIMYTELLTLGNQLVVIPNSTATATVVVNYSALDIRNIEFQIGVGYDTNLAECVRLMREVILQNPYVTQPDAVKIYVDNLGDSAITVYARIGVARESYYDARHDLYIEIKSALDRAGIDIPYPQMVVHQKNG